MKYRLLREEELEPLQEEFLKYLLVANITPENWGILKRNKLKESQEHLEVFSDMVLDKILSEVNYVDIVLENRVEVYHFMQEQVYLFSIENKILDSFDSKKNDWSTLDLKTSNLVKGKKAYIREKNEEIFELLNRPHAFISSGMLYKKIALLSVGA